MNWRDAYEAWAGAVNRLPNPGSPAAVEKGCTCPEPPDANVPTDPSLLRGFTVSSACPLHNFVKGWTAREAWTIEEIEKGDAPPDWL